jgi:hypothetical protein
MWFVKPGLSKPVPVSPRQKLVGGASYGDIAATNYAHDYSVISLSDESVNGEHCHVFDLKSASKKTTYDRIKYWVSKERLVGIKAEFFTVSGKLLKRAAFEHENRITLRSGPHPFISKMTIIDAIIRDNVTKLHLNEPKLTQVPPSALDLNVLMR